MVAGADQGDSFSRDMGYSKAEFLRVLPNALAGYAHTIDGNRVIITGPGNDQVLILTVMPLPDRKIAMMRISRISVEFAFDNFSASERRKFMAGFDRSYQKGGG